MLEIPFKNLTHFENDLKITLKEIESIDTTFETETEIKNSVNSMFIPGSTFEVIKQHDKPKIFAQFYQKQVEKSIFKKFLNLNQPYELNSDLIYYGQFYNEKAHGFGKLISKKSSILFEGHFIFGQIHGFGRLILSKGEIFEGRWFFNKILYGTYYNEFLKPIIQIKEFYLDFPQIRTQQNYNGNLINDKREGLGRYQWQDGTYYIGNFIDDKMCGFGKMIYKDGRIYIGYWKNNQMDGYGQFEWPNGQIYIGSYRKDQKNGLGMIILNGKVAIREFQHGKYLLQRKDTENTC